MKKIKMGNLCLGSSQLGIKQIENGLSDYSFTVGNVTYGNGVLHLALGEHSVVYTVYFTDLNMDM